MFDPKRADAEAYKALKQIEVARDYFGDIARQNSGNGDISRQLLPWYYITVIQSALENAYIAAAKACIYLGRCGSENFSEKNP